MGNRLSKIYTRTGDGGKTSLVGGERVLKSSLRIDAFGTVDELISQLGLVRTSAMNSENERIREESDAILPKVQNTLFDIGSILACAPGSDTAEAMALDAAAVELLEKRMDAYLEELDELKSFVLPGGSELNALSHVARAICRRAERVVWQLHEEEPVKESLRTYLNRLSDFLFVYSRWGVKVEGGQEFLWQPTLRH